MNRTLKFALTLSAFVLPALISGASAADLPRKHVYQPTVYDTAPVANWQGFTVEAYGEMANLNSHGTENFFGIIDVDHSAGTSGVRGGAKIGYDWQIGQLVVGPHIGYTMGKLETKTTDAFGITHSEAVKSQLDVVAQVGWAMGQFKPYVEGGVAFGSVEHCASIGTFFGECWTNRKAAPTAGVGIQMQLTPAVFADLSANATWYGSTDYTDATTGITGSANATVYGVRGGLGVRF